MDKNRRNLTECIPAGWWDPPSGAAVQRRDLPHAPPSTNVAIAEEYPPPQNRPLAGSMADIKGRLAEALVEQLFWKLGWKVHRFGMEHTHPHLFDSVRGRDDPVSAIIRSQPDFLVQKNDGQPYFVEVKYRANGGLSQADLGPNYPHLTAFIVLVSPYRIQCVTAGELRNGTILRRGASDYYFADRKEFGADLQVVRQFVDLASELFDKT